MQGGTTLLGARGAGDGLAWMTRIVRFIIVSVSTLFAIACSSRRLRPIHNPPYLVSLNPVKVLTFSGFYTQLLKLTLITAMIIAYLLHVKIFNKVLMYQFKEFTSLACVHLICLENLLHYLRALPTISVHPELNGRTLEIFHAQKLLLLH